MPPADHTPEPSQVKVEAPVPSPAPPLPMPPWKRFTLAAAALLGLFITWQVFTNFVAYTGDAYVRADLIAVASQVTGQISEIDIVDNQPVHKGDPLARIAPEPFQLAVNAAQETLRAASATAKADADSVSAARDDLQAAQAAFMNAQEAQQRSSALNRAGFASTQALDTTTATYASAEAQANAARAAVERAQAVFAADNAAMARAQAELNLASWRLGQTVLRAPEDGTINNLTLRIGDTAHANDPVIGIIAANNWRVIANYKQSYLTSLRPGGTAWISLDADPWHIYRAHIRSIGRGISRQRGDTGLLPYIQPTTDWIRLQHRFPVTLDLVHPPPEMFMGADARCLIFP